MKYLNGKVAMKGDAVVYITPKPDSFTVVGTVGELYERNGNVRINGYPLQVPSYQCVLAADAFEALSGQVLADAAAEAQKQTAPPQNDPAPADAPPAP